jgi:hypothetical protein
MRTIALLALPVLLLGCPDDEDTDDTDTPADTDTDTDAPIEAGTETVSATWDVDLFDPTFPSPTIPRFDTWDGRRQLDGMTIAVDHTSIMTIYVENGTDIPLTTDHFDHEYYFHTITQLGTADEDPPFFGPGAMVATQTADLAAADGTEFSGDDYYEETDTESVQFEAHYDWVETPTYLQAMIGTEDLQLVVGGFTESWVYYSEDVPEGAMIYAGGLAHQYSGTITITYEYSPAAEE